MYGFCSDNIACSLTYRCTLLPLSLRIYRLFSSLVILYVVAVSDMALVLVVCAACVPIRHHDRSCHWAHYVVITIMSPSFSFAPVLSTQQFLCFIPVYSPPQLSVCYLYSHSIIIIFNCPSLCLFFPTQYYL